MRATWMVLLAIAIGLILLQNWSPSLSLVLFGSGTPALPLAVWLGLGIVAGILTSFFLQLFNSRFSTLPEATNPEVAPRYRQTTSKNRRTRPPGKSDWEVSPSEDWDPLPEDDGGWDIDEAPATATMPQTDFPQTELRKNARATPQDSPPSERPSQRARTVSREQHQESPSPPSSQESTATPPQPKDGIYDADYRVIIPPPHAEEKEPSSENRDNWDF
ncbi:MAG: hypothetical protein AB4290_07810 [Spirulina sp.]